MRTRWVIWGAVLSAILLALLLGLQATNASILELETRWLALATLPLLIGLLAGGVIKRFSGFGIELEASLEAPVERIVLAAAAVAVELPGDEKRSIAQLHAIPNDRRLGLQRLSFVLNRPHHYASHAIVQYLEALPQLEFVEIRRSDGTFEALLPVSVMRSGTGSPDREVIQRFISALGQNELSATFENHIISDAVYADEEIIRVLPRIRQSRLGVLPVLDRSRQMIGVVTTASIEREIANAVLRARDSM